LGKEIWKYWVLMMAKEFAQKNTGFKRSRSLRKENSQRRLISTYRNLADRQQQQKLPPEVQRKFAVYLLASYLPLENAMHYATVDRVFDVGEALESEMRVVKGGDARGPVDLKADGMAWAEKALLMGKRQSDPASNEGSRISRQAWQQTCKFPSYSVARPGISAAHNCLQRKGPQMPLHVLNALNVFPNAWLMDRRFAILLGLITSYNNISANNTDYEGQLNQLAAIRQSYFNFVNPPKPQHPNNAFFQWLVTEQHFVEDQMINDLNFNLLNYLNNFYPPVNYEGAK
jgi:hypothetical protein